MSSVFLNKFLFIFAAHFPPHPRPGPGPISPGPRYTSTGSRPICSRQQGKSGPRPGIFSRKAHENDRPGSLTGSPWRLYSGPVWLSPLSPCPGIPRLNCAIHSPADGPARAKENRPYRAAFLTCFSSRNQIAPAPAAGQRRRSKTPFLHRPFILRAAAPPGKIPLASHFGNLRKW